MSAIVGSQACRMFSRPTIRHRAEFGTDLARDLKPSPRDEVDFGQSWLFAAAAGVQALP